MAKHNKEEVEILGGKATIYTNAYGVWQFRLWLTTDNKYVRKSLIGDEDKAKKKLKTKAVKKAKPFPSISPPTQTQQTSTQSAIPTSNAVTSTATTQMDYNKAKDNFVAKQTALQPIKPIATQ